ncbi:MAG: RNA polymerase sigma-54 factor [Flavobacteriales bacterium]|nr:MAG: RNA polymerase sigma-54 factor [Flavobacteriales bacterium]
MIKQSLALKLSQKLSPQQIQLMKLIQLPLQDLEQRIKEELETNPALEEGEDNSDIEELYANDSEYEDRDEEYSRDNEDIDIDQYLSDDEIPEYRLKANNYSADDESYEAPVVTTQSFYDLLNEQIGWRKLSDEDIKLARYLIGNLDDDGYLRRELSAIADDLAFSIGIYTNAEHLEKILFEVQTLDPAGVGARDLQECLRLQLERKKPSIENKRALCIVTDHYLEFTRKHYEKIISKLSISEEELRDSLEIISKLNPRPGNAVETGRTISQAITPDFIISINDGELELTLNSRNAPELNVSSEYRNMLEAYKAQGSKKDKKVTEAAQFVKQKLDAAKWFIDAIAQRQHTLYITMNTIMNYQEEYFLTGDEKKLRPMILKDIAEEINMDISTVSRVANSKYVLTPYGTMLIKSFFSESMTNEEGEEVSTREIKKILEESIGEENKRKPLTDEKLAKLLKEKGYPIARRTVAKYREQLDIPVARLRKEI